MECGLWTVSGHYQAVRPYSTANRQQRVQQLVQQSQQSTRQRNSTVNAWKTRGSLLKNVSKYSRFDPDYLRLYGSMSLLLVDSLD